MKKSQGMNALLIELVIVLFFFILSFTVLAQVYAYTYRTENRVAQQSDALFEARNLAEQLRSTQDPAAALLGMTDDVEENEYRIARDGYQLVVTCLPTETESGVYYEITIAARKDGDNLWTADEQTFSLPASVFVPGVTSYE